MIFPRGVSQRGYLSIKRSIHRHNLNLPILGDGDAASGTDFAFQVTPFGFDMRCAPLR